jgi:hypothetical protein
MRVKILVTKIKDIYRKQHALCRKAHKGNNAYQIQMFLPITMRQERQWGMLIKVTNFKTNSFIHKLSDTSFI